MTSEIWDMDVARWISDKIPTLSDRSKYRAYNSLRFARWAEDVRMIAPPVASFCALHAVEEAVAAFISSAKEFGHRRRAKDVNIHDHISKSLVSIFARRATIAATEGRLAVAVHPDKKSLAYRLKVEGEYTYNRLHLSVFHVDFSGDSESLDRVLLGRAPLLDDIQAEIQSVTDARNRALYASDKGYPVGFLDTEKEVKRATLLSLGLVWATVDLQIDPTQGGSFVQMFLDKVNEISSARKKKSKKDSQE